MNLKTDKNGLIRIKGRLVNEVRVKSFDCSVSCTLKLDVVYGRASQKGKTKDLICPCTVTCEGDMAIKAKKQCAEGDLLLIKAKPSNQDYLSTKGENQGYNHLGLVAKSLEVVTLAKETRS